VLLMSSRENGGKLYPAWSDSFGIGRFAASYIERASSQSGISRKSFEKTKGFVRSSQRFTASVDSGSLGSVIQPRSMNKQNI
jgi:hypothetical protein